MARESQDRAKREAELHETIRLFQKQRDEADLYQQKRIEKLEAENR